MNHNARIFCFLVVGLAGLIGCSSEPAKDTKKAAVVLDKIQGKAQVTDETGAATDATLNAGGHTVYIWEDARRYRLFLKSPVDLVHGSQYVVEGIDAQKAIDEIGDPDQGKNGYPLQTSCERVVRMAWPNLSFDAIDSTASLVRATVKRYPARHLFLVARIREASITDTTGPDAKKEVPAALKNAPEVNVPADKQKTQLIEGPVTQTAPLWEPNATAAKCKVIIDAEGKIESLETGAQLCEVVPWVKFKYQPPVQGGHPIKVATEVEIKFEPRK